MFAVIRTGGKQYRVSKDDVIAVESLAGAPGDAITLDDVLMVGEDGKAPDVGAPRLEKAAVLAEVVEQTRGDKIIVFKKQKRKGYRRKAGHRQNLTLLRITGISLDGKKPAAKAATKPKAKAAPEKAEKPAAKAKGKSEKAKTEAPKAQPKADAKPEAKAETKSKSETKAKDEPKAKAETKAKGETKAKTDAKAKGKSEAPKSAAKKPAAKPAKDAASDASDESKE